MELTLAVHVPGLEEEDRPDLIGEIATAIDQETPIAATLPKSTSVPGAKGLPLDWSAILLTLAGARSVLGPLFNTVRPFFERHPEMKLEMISGDRHFTVTIRDISPANIKSTLEAAAREFNL